VLNKKIGYVSKKTPSLFLRLVIHQTSFFQFFRISIALKLIANVGISSSIKKAGEELQFCLQDITQQILDFNKDIILQLLP